MINPVQPDFEEEHIDVEAFWREQGFDSLEADWLAATRIALETAKQQAIYPFESEWDVSFELISDE